MAKIEAANPKQKKKLTKKYGTMDELMSKKNAAEAEIQRISNTHKNTNVGKTLANNAVQRQTVKKNKEAAAQERYQSGQPGQSAYSGRHPGYSYSGQTGQTGQTGQSEKSGQSQESSLSADVQKDLSIASQKIVINSGKTFDANGNPIIPKSYRQLALEKKQEKYKEKKIKEITNLETRIAEAERKEAAAKSTGNSRGILGSIFSLPLKKDLQKLKNNMEIIEQRQKLSLRNLKEQEEYKKTKRANKLATLKRISSLANSIEGSRELNGEPKLNNTHLNE
jgi:hypothetical protein